MNNAGTIAHSIKLKEKKWSDAERKTRVDLAAAYRLVALFGWDELIYNHLTARIPGTDYILINPFGLSFDEITASSLVKIDLDGNVIDAGTTEFGFNITGYVIHGVIHRNRHDIVSTMHIHQRETVAVACYKDGLLPICQNALIFGEVAYHDYEGIAVDVDEQKRIIADLGPTKKNMFLRNHGILSCGGSIQEAFYNLHQMVKACEIQVSTLSMCGGDVSKLVPISKPLQQKVTEVAAGFIDDGVGIREFECLVRRLDRIDQSYKY